ncbi:hypothetical protein KI387_028027, partial [Taxus chinensis]
HQPRPTPMSTMQILPPSRTTNRSHETQPSVMQHLPPPNCRNLPVVQHPPLP